MRWKTPFTCGLCSSACRNGCASRFSACSAVRAVVSGDDDDDDADDDDDDDDEDEKRCSNVCTMKERRRLRDVLKSSLSLRQTVPTTFVKG